MGRPLGGPDFCLAPRLFIERGGDTRYPAAFVAALWEVIFNCSRIGTRSFWGSGRPRGPRRPFQKVGGFAPHLFEGLPGPPGPSRPQKRTHKIRPECLQVPGPAVFMDACYVYLGCPVQGEGPDGPIPSEIHGVGSVSLRIRGVIDLSFLF